MAGSSELDVRYVARLARIKITEEEVNGFQKQLDDVLKFVEKLRQADVSHVEPAAHALPIFNVFREDTAREWFNADEALRNAPRKANDLFIVPKVVE
jgi:aspartyl-tRNA(Asn)/glutamyl-tRNA(Gln) amidotransferase subunit C